MKRPRTKAFGIRPTRVKGWGACDEETDEWVTRPYLLTRVKRCCDSEGLQRCFDRDTDSDTDADRDTDTDSE